MRDFSRVQKSVDALNKKHLAVINRNGSVHQKKIVWLFILLSTAKKKKKRSDYKATIDTFHSFSHFTLIIVLWHFGGHFCSLWCHFWPN